MFCKARKIVFSVIFSVLLLAGCDGLLDGAMDRFASDYSYDADTYRNIYGDDTTDVRVDIPKNFNKELKLNDSDILTSVEIKKGSSNLKYVSPSKLANLRDDIDNEAYEDFEENTETYASDEDYEKLLVVSEGGKVSQYLNARFDRFHVVDDENDGIAYLVRIADSEFQRSKLKDGGWFLLKNGQRPIKIRPPKDAACTKNCIYGFRDISEFMGQTSSLDLVFQRGTFFSIDGKPKTLGKKINVTWVKAVQGNIVIVEYEIAGRRNTILVDVDKGRSSPVGSLSSPKIAQFGDKKGWLSNSGVYTSGLDKSYISKLEEDLDYDDDNNERVLLDASTTGGCMWFNGSVSVPEKGFALLPCYINEETGSFSWFSGNYLVAAYIDGDKVVTKRFEEAPFDSHDFGHGSINDRSFVKGKDFIVMNDKEENYYLIKHNEAKDGIWHKLPIGKSTKGKGKNDITNVFSIRRTNDGKNLLVTGMNNRFHTFVYTLSGQDGSVINSISLD